MIRHLHRALHDRHDRATLLVGGTIPAKKDDVKRYMSDGEGEGDGGDADGGPQGGKAERGPQ